MKKVNRSQDNRERVSKNPLPALTKLLHSGLLMVAAVVLAGFASGYAQAEVSDGTIKTKANTNEMVLIPGSTFVMGNEGAYADELPRHEVRMSSFYLDAHEVTNAQFAEFVKATGYVTQAEHDGHCWAYFKG